MVGKGLLGMAILLGVTSPQVTWAAIPNLYTNDNFLSSEHDKPLSFNIDVFGNAEGVTETGKLFYQKNVSNSYGIRLQKFSIDEAYFYISDQGIITANTDLEALSIYLTKTA
jgi:hypothetical protein